MKVLSRYALKSRKVATLTAIFLFAVGCGSDAPVEPVIEPPIVEPPEPPGPEAFPAGVHPLAGISVTLPHGDLEPLREIVGNARFVALGESYHMSGGFYQAKSRLIRYMIQELGFRVVAMETPWLEARPAADYVASCAGSTSTALAGLLTVWRDTHVRDMLAWLCQYNRQNPADPVTFFGFDIQEPWRSAPAVRQFLLTAGADTGRATSLFRCLGTSATSLSTFYTSEEHQNHSSGNRNAIAHQECLDGIAGMESWIAANEAPLAAATSPTAVEETRIALVGLRAWEQQLWLPDPHWYEARDVAMAETLRRVHALHTPAQKTIVWAWNWHIARDYASVRGFDHDRDRILSRQGGPGMGTFLHDALGADYLPIALIGYDVRIPGYNQPAIPTSELSVEKRLHAFERDYLLVDLRQPLPDTLLPPGRTYLVSHEWGDPYRQFGALLYLDYSPAMVFVSVPSP